MNPIDTAPTTGTPFRALSGRTELGQRWRWDAEAGTFLQYVKRLEGAHSDQGGTWHVPFFKAIGWLPE